MVHFTPEQRDAWAATTRDSPFNRWLRHRTTGRNGSLDLDLLHGVAAEFGIDAARYAHLNPGQQRMNIGNRLRRIVPETAYGASQAPTAATLPARVANIAPASVVDDEWPILQRASATTLMRFQAAAIDELRRRAVVRTGNAPLGDYAEHLLARTFSWRRTPNSAIGHDAVDDAGHRYQIKARRLGRDNAGERQLGVMRGLTEGQFDYLAAILFDPAFVVYRAAIIPVAVVTEAATYSVHVNGWRFMLNDAVWQADGVRDITSDVRQAASAIDEAPAA